ncbi:hypothetical protein [Bacillus thuringiensis]|uniref:hypothetical protein n=1 Tax=Bacillus thuringiensis TaxID=1428 RepID=UPI0005CDE7D7|nr:hypothetical protein [Bacillus thuringiensis]
MIVITQLANNHICIALTFKGNLYILGLQYSSASWQLKYHRPYANTGINKLREILEFLDQNIEWQSLLSLLKITSNEIHLCPSSSLFNTLNTTNYNTKKR